VDDKVLDFTHLVVDVGVHADVVLVLLDFGFESLEGEDLFLTVVLGGGFDGGFHDLELGLHGVHGSFDDSDFVFTLVIGTVEEFHGIVSVVLVGIFDGVHETKVFHGSGRRIVRQSLNGLQGIGPGLNSNGVEFNVIGVFQELALIFVEFLNIFHFLSQH